MRKQFIVTPMHSLRAHKKVLTNVLKVVDIVLKQKHEKAIDPIGHYYFCQSSVCDCSFP